MITEAQVIVGYVTSDPTIHPVTHGNQKNPSKKIRKKGSH